MRGLLTLDSDKYRGTDNRNGIERQIHDVTNDGLWAESIKWTLEDLAQFLHRITARFDLSSLAHDLSVSACEQSAVECVKQCIPEEIVSRNEIDDSGAFVENEQTGGYNCEWSVDKDENGELGKIRECEHATDDTCGEENQGTELGEEWRP